MSDLLIKNLELPKEGRIQLSVYPNGKVINHSSFTDTTLLSVELPEHGDLWEKDNVLAVLDKRINLYKKKGYTDDDDEVQEIVNIQTDLIASVPTVLDTNKD